ncbi:MAG TPA: hypothetical protein PKA16_07870 [Ottowia sp.]|uniref:hypothetical protein n=1 Tax=Ottowia sp. TaxID=1898956 RepID=UPI002BC4C298|nr:hypothetical protein [Ottowia sp.]HMN21295.1 hypothetical protein [Ottowia sp.]
MITRLTGLALCTALALPALAQITPVETNLDEAAARLEMRNAQEKELTAVSADEALANALKRCDNLPEFYKADCIARVKGQGEVSGSVIGGGLLKESVTTLPKATLEEEIRAIPPIHLPPQP